MPVEPLPDRQPDAFIQFQLRPVEDREATAKKGYSCMVDQEVAVITPPGGNLVVEKFVSDFTHRDWERFKPQYTAWKEGREPPADGLSIRSWPLSTPAFLEMCMAARVRTVEELAEANEAVLDRLGMAARNWKQKAEAYLAHAADGGKVAEENAQMRARIEDQQEALDRLTSEIEALKKQLPDEPQPRRKRSA